MEQKRTLKERMPKTAEIVAAFRAGWGDDADVSDWVMGRDGGAFRAQEGAERYEAGRWMCDPAGNRGER